MTTSVNNTILPSVAFKIDPGANDVKDMREKLAALASELTTLNNMIAAANPPVSGEQDLINRFGDEVSVLKSLTNQVAGDISAVEDDAAEGSHLAEQQISKPMFDVMEAALNGDVSGQGSLIGTASGSEDDFANLLYQVSGSSTGLTNFAKHINDFLTAR